MVVQRIGTTGLAHRRRWCVACLCVFVLLLGLLVAGAGLRCVQAQADPPAEHAVTAPANENPLPPSQDPQSAATSTANPAVNTSPQEKHKQEVAAQCANLLKMATDLKTEVDKTTKDELSVAVVRKAGEIEQFARKVRGDIQSTTGKN